MLFNYSEMDILLSLSLVMFAIGMYGMVTKRNAIRLVMAIEILVSACNLAFLCFGYSGETHGDPITQTYIILSLSVGAAVIGLALAMLRNLYLCSGNTLDVREFKSSKW